VSFFVSFTSALFFVADVEETTEGTAALEQVEAVVHFDGVFVTYYILRR
jgi:hypothetical protein